MLIEGMRLTSCSDSCNEISIKGGKTKKLLHGDDQFTNAIDGTN